MIKHQKLPRTSEMTVEWRQAKPTKLIQLPVRQLMMVQVLESLHGRSWGNSRINFGINQPWLLETSRKWISGLMISLSLSPFLSLSLGLSSKQIILKDVCQSTMKGTPFSFSGTLSWDLRQWYRLFGMRGELLLCYVCLWSCWSVTYTTTKLCVTIDTHG